MQEENKKQLDQTAKSTGNGKSKDFKTKSKSRGNRRSGGYKDLDRENPKSDSKVFVKPGNDFSWWNKFPEIMKDATNMRSNWIPGTNALNTRGTGVGVPGACGFWLIDTYGWDSSTAGPINMTARDLYLKMFQKYRGISSYQAADVGIVLVAGIEVVKTVAVLERIYGIINRYARGNWNMPYTELAAMGISDSVANAIRKQLSNYRYNLNILINKCQRFCIPKDMSVIANKLSLYGYEFQDHESGKSQIIVFNPTYYGIFDETSLTTGSAVRFESYPVAIEGTSTSVSLVNVNGDNIEFPVLERQLDAMLGSDSVQKIFGDFLAWFGEEQMLKLLTMPDDYVVVPVYSKEILHKIHNMDIIIPCNANGDLDFTTDLKVGSYSTPMALSAEDRRTLRLGAADDRMFVYQHENLIETRFGFVSGEVDVSQQPSSGYPIGAGLVLPYFHMSDARLIDGYTDDWSDEFVCEGSLFKAFIAGSSTSAGRGAHLTTAAFEVCVQCRFYTRTSDGIITQMAVNNFSKSASDRELKLQTLDWAPIIYRASSFDFTNPYIDIVTPLALYGDIECCRQVNAEDVARIHRAAAMSGLKTDVIPRT